MSRYRYDDDDDLYDARQEMAAYERWKRHQYDDTPIEYHHSLRTTWADYEKAVSEVNDDDDSETDD